MVSRLVRAIFAGHLPYSEKPSVGEASIPLLNLGPLAPTSDPQSISLGPGRAIGSVTCLRKWQQCGSNRR